MSKKQVIAFIESIPPHKLENFPTGRGTLFPKPVKEGDNFRLDKQNEGLTAEGYHNLQIQANRQAKSSSARKKATATAAGALSKPDTSVATVLVLDVSVPRVSPEDVRQAFQESYKSGNIPRLGTKPPQKTEVEATEIQSDEEGESEEEENGS